MLVIALTAQVCSLNLQGYMRGQDPLLEIDAISAYADPGSLFDPEGYLFVVPITIHACSILVLNLVYRRISMWLTALENYPTETEHEHAMIVKRVCFEFVDCFAALFYVAFYRRDIVQLRQELLSLYTFDQVRRVALETVMPFVTQRASHWWHHRSSRTEGSATLDDGVGASPSPSSSAKLHDDRATFTRAMDEIEKEEYESFDDYMEMTMQYGYVTLFASAFPLAAVCSVIGNLLEINSDFVKLRYVLRRPLPRREVSIGPWVQVLRLFTYISVITNVSVFAYTSNQMRTAFPRYFNALGEMRDGTEEYVVVALFVLEHLLLAAVFFIDWWIPRIPYSVKSLMRQRQKRIAQISTDAQQSNDVKRPRHTSKKQV
ncbi:Anoctamin, putative [Bodo saltans]|uniref:Anoctamin, putative n=1 Tax=Bodo saltans TaxID=75058 RepID=A0A0S4IPB7_BODSA|nr:Anoctamin, putative [Bodo saltans]|eukprot:CUF02836.1 Anoctamin, putative [Bodo saltans]